MGTNRLLGRGLARSVYLVAALALATVSGATLHSAFWSGQDGPEGSTASPPMMTSGGKFVARLEGATSAGRNGAPRWRRPTLSIVNWAGTPTRSSFLIDDVAWAPLHDRVATVPTAPFKAGPPAHDVKHSTPLAVAGGPPRPRDNFPQPEVRTASAPMLIEVADHGLWPTTKSAVRGLVSLGDSMLGHLLP